MFLSDLKFTRRRGVKDGTGANYDVIFESKLEFEYFENSVQIHIPTDIVRMPAIWLSPPDCVFE